MIDWGRVDQLKNEIGTDDFDEVVELFLEEVDEVVARLKNAPDPAHLGDEFHFLKGSALNLGFKDLANQCQDGEALAKLGQADDVVAQRIVRCYHTSRQTFLAGLTPGVRQTG